MVTVNPIVSSAMVALRVMQADRLSEPDSGQEAAPSAASPLDPRNASLVSARAAAAISDLVRGGQAIGRVALHAENNAGTRQRPTEEEFAKAMAETPPEDIDRVTAFGATRWIRHAYPVLDDASFNKVVMDLESETVKTGDLSSADYVGFKEAFAEGKITIVRQSKVPELSGMLARTYDLYYSDGGTGATYAGYKTANDCLMKFKNDHPDMNVISGGINDDGYLLCWSKPAVPASAV